jgi:hypothetical protein
VRLLDDQLHLLGKRGSTARFKRESRIAYFLGQTADSRTDD